MSDAYATRYEGYLVSVFGLGGALDDDATTSFELSVDAYDSNGLPTWDITLIHCLLFCGISLAVSMHRAGFPMASDSDDSGCLIVSFLG